MSEFELEPEKKAELIINQEKPTDLIIQKKPLETPLDHNEWLAKFLANLPINLTHESKPTNRSLPPQRLVMTGHGHQAGTPIAPSEFSTGVLGQQHGQTSETDTPSIQLWEPITIPPKKWWDVKKNELAMLPDHRFGHFDPQAHASLAAGHDHSIAPQELTPEEKHKLMAYLYFCLLKELAS